MYYVRHYSIRCSKEYAAQLKNRLITLGLKDVKVFDSITDNSCNIYFDLSERHKNFSEIISFLPIQPLLNYEEYKKLSVEERYSVPRRNLLFFREYEKNDYDNANWLTVRSSFIKCEPDNFFNVFKDIHHQTEYDDKIISVFHEVTDEYHKLKKPVKWGKRFFCSSVLSEYTLFCNQKTKDILTAAGFKGIDYIEVSDKKGDKIFQVCPLHTAPAEAFGNVVDMDSYECNVCNNTLYAYQHTRGIFSVREELLDNNVDAYLTPSIFSAGVEDRKLYTHQILLFSKRLYVFLKENNMDRALWFEPLANFK